MKKENENEKVQSKVEKTVEHKDKKDVTPEEKLNNIIKKAKEKGLRIVERMEFRRELLL